MQELVLTAALAAGIFVVAGAAQAVTGFGMALAAVPLLSLFVETGSVVVGAVAVGAVFTGAAWWRERAYADLVVARRLSGAALVGMPAGLVALAVLSERALTLLIGVVVLVMVAAVARQVPLPSGVVAQRVAGVASGGLLTSTSMNGPPLVLVLHGAGLSPRAFRATLQAVFCVQGLVGIAGFAVLGYVDPPAAAVAVGGWCGVPLGWVAGDRVFHRMSPEVFRRVVLLGLAVTALVALLDAALA